MAAIAGVESYERMPSGDPDAFPALALYDGGHGPIEFQAGTTQYDLTITVEGYVEGGDGAQAHADMHDLYEAVKTALITEPPLGGLVETIDEADFRVDVAELAKKRRIGFGLDVRIQFSTPR
ncbi:hypothetical protein [Sphingomonas sp. DBB INV C78]|uniref:hypothetical protein n=1 Tax=Sphingomonas sp. DBB INV C78 TaxID=3349434 RepID=UPI0036D41095